MHMLALSETRRGVLVFSANCKIKKNPKTATKTMDAAIIILVYSFFQRFFAWCTFLPQAKPLVTMVLVLKLTTKKKEKIES
jgi:hypothetical protein